MARVFITGSSDGLGRMAAELLVEEGHAVVLHGIASYNQDLQCDGYHDGTAAADDLHKIARGAASCLDFREAPPAIAKVTRKVAAVRVATTEPRCAK